MRPILRPGLQILRRDVRSLQLGLDWPGVEAVWETPGLRAVLASVDGFRDVEGVLLAAREQGVSWAEAEAGLDVLLDRGALVDRSATRRTGVDESTWAAWWLLAGPGRCADELLAEQRERRICVQGSGRVADVVRSLLRASPTGWCNERDEADLLVIATDTEPARAWADEAMHTGIPHVWVFVRDTVGVVGPFVDPGKTACLRCVDASRAALDPAWPTLLASSFAAPLAAPACDPILATLIGAWVAQDALLWSAGLRPHTWGAVIEIPQGCGAVQTATFSPHPHCGCGWPVWQETMES
ncbi:MAG: hypothetical protein ACR2KG_06110 [Nocardioidaceae bacterium]